MYMYVLIDTRINQVCTHSHTHNTLTTHLASQRGEVDLAQGVGPWLSEPDYLHEGVYMTVCQSVCLCVIWRFLVWVAF